MGPRSLEAYRGLTEPRLFREIEALADRLRGRRILQVNATAKGGGVAEILRCSVPLLRDLGIEADWQVPGHPDHFFEITRKIHDGLQGGPGALTEEEWSEYERANREAAGQLDPSAWDLIVVHDPQPCAIRGFIPPNGRTRWVWRSHIDTSKPNPSYRRRLARYIAGYDALVYTLPQYAFDGATARRSVIEPAIDPLSAKNEPMALEDAQGIVAGFGLDPRRPLATQVSRFDHWKDPLGVLRAHEAAQKEVPGLQLALIGETAHDDPDGLRVLAKVREAAAGRRSVEVIADVADDRQVNAFQTASTVVLQKSLREGFGLTVSEALWAGTPVIGGRAGGIPHQIRHGKTGFLVDSVEEAASRMVELARDPGRARRMGEQGHRDVERRFLLTRLLRDELRLWAALLEGPRGRRVRATVPARRPRRPA